MIFPCTKRVFNLSHCIFVRETSINIEYFTLHLLVDTIIDDKPGKNHLKYSWIMLTCPEFV
jgi:hypothetical protein